ncbi:LON peptidase substrate-binding domain-containing protein [Maribacter sp. 2307ULW6-5]|uniref:LON peptidase substrate-binding domain-containing protein n=1 Tax=Maribacter sp. 2307ULW6-5 TaxID=3386275 RepID=UPI0039BC8B21
MKIPLFPLASIFFPGETVPLHIFEPRYKDLIRDCREEAITFGIPVVIRGTMEYGTEVQLVEVVNTYEGGEMDVVCVARQVFRLRSFENQMDDKAYGGGLVQFLEYDFVADEGLKNEVIQSIGSLYRMMEVPFTDIDAEVFTSFTLAHKMGLSFEQEYELLQMSKEQNRLLYLKKHLQTTIAVLAEVERTKKAIELNGHFKNFDPLDFKDLSF